MTRHQRAVVVDAVAGHVDHPADAAIAAALEQRRGEQQRARDRGARGARVARAADVGGKAIGRFRPVDQPPRHDDLLVVHAGPFEIGHGDAAVHALLQRLQEFARRERRHIAFALQRLLLGIHRIGNVDREHDLGVDRDGRRRAALRQHLRVAGRGEAKPRERGHGSGRDDGKDRDTPPHARLPWPIPGDGGTEASGTEEKDRRC